MAATSHLCGGGGRRSLTERQPDLKVGDVDTVHDGVHWLGDAGIGVDVGRGLGLFVPEVVDGHTAVPLEFFPESFEVSSDDGPVHSDLDGGATPGTLA